MTIQNFDETNSFENITLDKQALLTAYLELDKLFYKDLKNTWELTRIYRLLEKATGYGFIRSLEKKSQEEISEIKI